MADLSDSPSDRLAPAAAATRREDALRRRAEALRENLRRRKAQARGRKAGAAPGAPENDGGDPART